MSAAEPEVRIPAGVVRGRSEGGLAVFRGIPYAAAPLGAARFRAPQPVDRWNGVRDAGAFWPPRRRTRPCPGAAAVPTFSRAPVTSG
jgi:para-nitrobenzyl esterase